MLTDGEFFGLKINAWRNRFKIKHHGMPPQPYWVALDWFALYRRTRAVAAKRHDDALCIETARKSFKVKYSEHRELYRREHRGDTVH